MIVNLRLGEPIWRKVDRRELVVEWDVPGSTVSDFLVEVGKRFPELAQELPQLLPQAPLQEPQAADSYYTIFVNGRQIRWSEGRQTFLSDGDEVLIILPLSGG